MAADRTPDPVTRAFTLLTERAVSLHAAAVLRAGYGLLYLAFLLREFPHRDEIWGPGSPWSPALARELQGRTGWFSVLTLSDRPAWFACCYAFALLVCALFALGWRTRALSVLFALVVTSFHGRAILMTDGGDNLIVLMAVYLAFTACGSRWSLDARRRGRRPARPAVRQTALVRVRLRTVLHNCAMFVIAAQVCVLYGSTGLYKVQGDQWRDGTALHYVLHLGLFQPWPALSHLADQHPLALAVTGYLTVLVQVAVPFAAFSRAKYAVLALLLGMHLGIAVLLGLPVFSGAMIVADAVFLPDRFFRSLRRPDRSRRTGAAPAVPAPAVPDVPARV
ncbi:HTTM domain-containing protein [Streptomyces sp. SL13]|uniref:HTTM domain-containing protein n=1 Tax=Streptantibioticus silvisoli TaxID=2705255 RepID=A0AA90H5E5_9ACTN|nr:HTTM domain-containing protein [Streptantibioticus silvisoli]MDI5971288.1 HTTM domain-containing protein [Streptantibioticus silvisoli]